MENQVKNEEGIEVADFIRHLKTTTSINKTILTVHLFIAVLLPVANGYSMFQSLPALF